MKIAIFTNEPSFMAILPHIFKTICDIFPLQQIVTVKEMPVCTHLIVGVESINETIWPLLRRVVRTGLPAYLMVTQSPTPSEYERIKFMEIEILDDPLKLIVGNAFDKPLELLERMKHKRLDRPSNALIYLENGVHFNTNLNCVIYDDKRIPLSLREMQVLTFFIHNQGKIITKQLIAQEIWGSYVSDESVSKLIHRLKVKLGPASEVIASRKSGGGGYYFEQSEQMG